MSGVSSGFNRYTTAPVLVLLVLLSAHASRATSPETIPGHVLVKVRLPNPDANTTASTRSSVSQLTSGIDVVPEIVMRLSGRPQASKAPAGDEEWILLKGPRDLDVAALISQLRLRDDVIAAEPDYLMRLAEQPRAPNTIGQPTPVETAFTPNDPKLAEQWGLTWIEAPAAWSISQGAASQVIAIIDTGIDLTHPDLTSKLWSNSDESSGDKNGDGCPGVCGTDDDGDGFVDEDGAGVQKGAPGWNPAYAADDDENGYIDDFGGWDWIGGDAVPNDDNGHGTFCAGVAAAATNNGIGIAGTCPLCRIMPLKAFKSDGTASFSDIAKAVDYARRNGATVISMSFASTTDAQALRDAVAAAYPTATLVASAGNDRASRVDPLCEASGLEYPVASSYPANYPHVLGVEAHDQNGRIAVFSNCQYSLRLPGTAIESTVPNSSYTAWSGTSMSAPFVAGIAGLLRGYKAGDGTWTEGLIYNQLVQSGGNARKALSLVPEPKLELESVQVLDDCAGCDHDATADAGERIKLVTKLRNVWSNATNVAGSLTTASGDVTIVTGTASFGDIAANATATATFVADVKSTAANNAAIEFSFAAKPSNTPTTFTSSFSVTTVNATPKSGTLSSSEAWTSARVYRITGNLIIPAGITLTIGPGTHVEIGTGYSIVVAGTLVARGTPSQRIEFSGNNWAGIVFQAGSTAATFDGLGNYLSGGAIEYATLRGCLGSAVVKAANTWVARNVFTGNSSTDGVSGSAIAGSSLRVEQNLFTDNHFGSNGTGAAISALSDGTYVDNTIAGNDADAIRAGGCYTIRNNSLFRNSGYELRATYGSETTCSFAENYWGTSDAAAIAAEVYDFNENGSVGRAETSSPLVEPSPRAPATVTGIVLDPASPVGTGRVTMTASFSRPMAMEHTPAVTFGPLPPYLNPVSIDGRWIGGVDVVATSPGGSSTLPRAFTFIAPPLLSSVAPTTGPTTGGTTVTITGVHLVDATVEFGGSAAAVVSSSATSITVTSPAHTAGQVDIVVTTIGGTTTLTGAFTYGGS